MKRVLVTGHMGYIGTVLTPVLEAAGYEVLGMDSDLYRDCTYGNAPPNVPSLMKDIRDAQVEDLIGFEALIHLAALSNDPLGNIDPDLTYQINYLATVRLAEMAKEAGVSRFLFSSSCSTYGAAGESVLNEASTFNPVTPYGRSKVLAEKAVSELADDKFSPVFLRNATAYGVSPRLRFDLVLNNLVAWATSTGRVYLKSDGTPWRPIVHIEDISRAFIAVLEAPIEVVHNQAFNVGRTGENYRISELAEIVRETVPGCRIQYAEGAGPDRRSYRVDCSKLTQALPQFKPQWNARDGARQLYESFRSANLQLDEFEGPRYKRIAHIQQLLGDNRLHSSLRWRMAAEEVQA